MEAEKRAERRQEMMHGMPRDGITITLTRFSLVSIAVMLGGILMVATSNQSQSEF